MDQQNKIKIKLKRFQSSRSASSAKKQDENLPLYTTEVKDSSMFKPYVINRGKSKPSLNNGDKTSTDISAQEENNGNIQEEEFQSQSICKDCDISTYSNLLYNEKTAHSYICSRCFEIFKSKSKFYCHLIECEKQAQITRCHLFNGDFKTRNELTRHRVKNAKDSEFYVREQLSLQKQYIRNILKTITNRQTKSFVFKATDGSGKIQELIMDLGIESNADVQNITTSQGHAVSEFKSTLKEESIQIEINKKYVFNDINQPVKISVNLQNASRPPISDSEVMHTMVDDTDAYSQIKNTLYLCKTCFEVFDSVPSLLDHYHLTGNAVCTCNICNETFHSKKELLIHKHDMHLFSCTLCKETFRNKFELTSHEFKHEIDVYACSICQICGYRFLNQKKLSHHLRVHKPDKSKYQTRSRCTICCEKIYPQSSYAKNVMKKYGKPFCMSCFTNDDFWEATETIKCSYLSTAQAKSQNCIQFSESRDQNQQEKTAQTDNYVELGDIPVILTGIKTENSFGITEEQGYCTQGEIKSENEFQLFDEEYRNPTEIKSENEIFTEFGQVVIENVENGKVKKMVSAINSRNGDISENVPVIDSCLEDTDVTGQATANAMTPPESCELFSRKLNNLKIVFRQSKAFQPRKFSGFVTKS